MKIVYNACFGGFGLSDAAVRLYAHKKGLPLYVEKHDTFSYSTYWLVPEEERLADLEGEDWRNASQEERIAYNAKYAEQTLDERRIPRNDPALVAVVEELGEAANGLCADLRIAEIPEGQKYRIDEYDGRETVMRPDDYNWDVA